jgi:phosphoglycerate kinase
MIDLPKLTDLDIKGKRVVIRADLDVDVTQGSKLKAQNSRLMTLIPALKYLHEHGAKKIIVIGHRGRPRVADSFESTAGGNKELSLQPISEVVEKMLEEELGEEEMKKLNMQMMENLRFNEGEEKDDGHFAKHLAEQADIYVNECFSTSHREHASIVALPKQFKSKFKSSVAIGFRFQKEIKQLSKILDNPKKPLIVVISGVKEDKLSYVELFLKFIDKVLVGGRLPEYIDRNPKSEIRNPKLVIARLLPDKDDITMRSIEEFEKEIIKAGTIVVSGPIGKFEEEGHKQGTERVFKAVVKNKEAFKVAGGGDTERAISELEIRDQFDWISVGGGAMLEFLTKGTLPGIEALIN